MHKTETKKKRNGRLTSTVAMTENRKAQSSGGCKLKRLWRPAAL